LDLTNVANLRPASTDDDSDIGHFAQNDSDSSRESIRLTPPSWLGGRRFNERNRLFEQMFGRPERGREPEPDFL
jgi:hypothetical protein